MKSSTDNYNHCSMQTDCSSSGILCNIKHDISVKLNTLMETEVHIFDQLLRCLRQNQANDERLLALIQVGYAGRLRAMRSLMHLWYKESITLGKDEIDKSTYLIDLIQYRYQKLKDENA